jgi:hypothetical protein
MEDCRIVTSFRLGVLRLEIAKEAVERLLERGVVFPPRWYLTKKARRGVGLDVEPLQNYPIMHRLRE